jgi:hypothetical protein
MEAASTSETSANFCQITRRNDPEDSHLQTNTYAEHLLAGNERVRAFCWGRICPCLTEGVEPHIVYP